ncbi:MAG TPA: response regulator [Pyrinomonadaceae bacterium]|nr:response regulator [Pyrinomonadaceae bacterium]
MKDINKHTILAINDNPSQLVLLNFILDHAGYRVVTAVSGNKGFEVAARELPDLIISDVMMSDGDGIELCQMIRGDARLCLLPILLLSALRKDTDSVLLGLEAGADDYVEVPYIAETLIAKAARLIERKLAADALRESEENYRILAETASDAIIKIDADSRILFINRAGEKIFGYPVDEMLGQPLTMLMSKSMRTAHHKGIEHYLETGKKSVSWNSMESIALHRNGNEFPIELSFSEHQEGKNFFIGIARDITGRKQAENALRESEEHFSIAQEVARIGSFELDLKTREAKTSLALEALYSAPPGALNKKFEDWAKYLHPEDLPKAAQEMERMMATGEHDSEFRIIQKDGSIRWLYSKGKVFYDDEGVPLRLVGVNMDVTERKQAEAALAEANDRAIREYDRLLERLATLGQKLGTGRDLTAIFSAILEFALASVPCSALFISLYDKEQSTRKIIYMWYNGNEMEVSSLEPVPVNTGSVGQSIRSGEVIIVDDYLKTLGEKLPRLYLGFEEDSREPRSMVVAPMKIMGSVVGVIEIQSYDLAAYTAEHAIALRMAANLAANAIENVRLLEQERESAEQLRQAQKLESVGRLAGGIAHDFNNMLTAINGYSDLILRQLDDDSPIRSKIKEIKKAGERSAALTHQLLAFSRRQMLKTKVLNINEVIVETSKMLQRLIGEDVQLNIKPDSKIGRIDADPGQLAQVVMNLAVNARDSMPHGGELTIETANIYLDEEYAARHVPTRPGAYVLLSVSDTGTGMDEETQQNIFEPFFTTKEIGKGTGLGLATVYGIVKQSGGYIWVESEVGKGTKFNIYLPRIEEKVELSEDQSAADYTRKGNETILLVEDEEILRNLCRQILESCGYKVIEAGNGSEALAICREADYKIDLVLTDVVMPKMSGRQLVEQLAVLRPEIKVIYMSGYTDDKAVRQDAAEEGANFIPKPFTFNTLAEKVRELLDTKTERKAAGDFSG